MVGECRVRSHKLRIAVGRQIDAGEGLVVQSVREGQRDGGDGIIPVIADVRRARHDAAPYLSYRVVAVAVGVGVGVGVRVGVDVGDAVGVGVGVGLADGRGVAVPPPGPRTETVMGEPVLKKSTVASTLCGAESASNQKLYNVPKRIAFALGFCAKVSVIQ